ncbi:sugar nucleotide-binding protein [uncultured Oscillibacter sp.]|uniref:sugar nucleotide-binding protein n=1 Tax=uncultured Oscillibacter sp. TaxID=876091 RepID=UPI002619BA50|nr:sugar nucleotide-binding protein [uncultured Oscillibacter sp.]
MKKILILGSTGLLGNAVASHFLGSGEYQVVTTYRDPSVAFGPHALYFDAHSLDFSPLPGDADYVINCIGVIKPFMAASEENAIVLNALLPWRLADWCGEHGSGLIHITTDCVYFGRKGRYVESDPHDALDAYGKSKSLGECASKAMVLRTSIIGEEIHKNASLLAWAKSQRGRRVQGFTTHLWNGVTTRKYAEICDEIISRGLYERGLFHVHASDDVSKCEMLGYFNEKYHLDLEIEPASPPPCDRTLRSEKPLCAALRVPTVRQMIEEL